MSVKFTHFFWCALVAVEMARSDGKIQTREGEQDFIIKWMQGAQKKKLFCREVAPVLLALLKLNSLYGASISIREILNYCWQLNTESLRKQTDFYRLHCALTLLNLPEVQNFFLSGHKQSGDYRVLSNNKMKIFLDKKTLLCAFDNNGKLIAPLVIKVEFDISLVESIMKKCGFDCAVYEDNIIKLTVDMK
ncbi:DUF2913 family protein [Citrobacter amalonaticus]|nr:DUF2913 family protein [Citrobacter amalonaticus]